MVTVVIKLTAILIAEGGQSDIYTNFGARSNRDQYCQKQDPLGFLFLFCFYFRFLQTTSTKPKQLL